MIPSHSTIAYAASHRARELQSEVRQLERNGRGNTPQAAKLRDQAMTEAYRAKYLRESAPDDQRRHLNDLFERGPRR